MKNIWMLVVGIISTVCTANAQDASKKDEAPAVEKKWVCTADGLASFRYSGGDWAYIHLSPYPNGGSYPATKTGSIATGKTKDGTPFTCKEE